MRPLYPQTCPSHSRCLSTWQPTRVLPRALRADFAYFKFFAPLDGATYEEYVAKSLFRYPVYPRNDTLLSEVLAEYPAVAGDNRPVLSAVMGDYSFSCSTYNFADIVAAAPGSSGTCARSFLYRFAVPLTCPAMFVGLLPANGSVPHYLADMP